MPEKSIILKPGREKSLQRRHPWVFSGAVSRLDGGPLPGETVQVKDTSGSFLAWAAYSPKSQITARVWSWSANETITPNFLEERLHKAIDLRHGLLPDLIQKQTACRLVHAESDGLPGLVVDRYGDVLVVQISSQGAEFWRDTIYDLLEKIPGITCLYERSDMDVRSLEGLDERIGLVKGDAFSGRIEIVENGARFLVDIIHGHKTGYYLDQRDNRRVVRELSHDRQVLDCFCYTGGFTVNAVIGGASAVMAVDSSRSVLDQAAENFVLNGLPADRVTWQEGDVFQVLRTLRDRGQQFDMIILDPPKFAATSAQVERAARGYKDINLLAFKLLRSGGLLVTFSCSGGIGEELFQKIIAGAALDAGVDGQILQYLHQAADHPVALNFPEGAYLKGLVIQKP